MKLEPKRGGLRVLNIYTVAHRTLLGYVYLAQDAEQVGVLDGVVVDYRTLPGKGLEIYSEGDTAMHEVGHWLDLFHTFDGGCNRGDLVEDTAPEARRRSSARSDVIRARDDADSTPSGTSGTTRRTAACSGSATARPLGCVRPGPRTAP